MKKIIYIAISLIVSLTSCKGTWLMYDTSQKDRIAFIEVLQTHTASFALIAENEIRVSAEVLQKENANLFSSRYLYRKTILSK